MKEQILQLRKENVSTRKIQKILQISQYKIYKVLKEEGLVKSPVFIDYKKQQKEIIKLYTEGKTIANIGKILNADSKRISKVLKNNGIIVKKCAEINRKNNFNEDYFEKIDTEDKAYFLGLLYADGNIYLKRNRVQITLQKKDKYILEEFSKFINSTAKLYVDREKYYKLILDSKKMVKDLINLGCIPKKSLKLKFPSCEQVPENLMNHFIRGYFDGDGSISNSGTNGNEISFTGSENFISALIIYMKSKNFNFYKFDKRYKNKENSAGSTKLYQNCKTVDFYNYLYKNCSPNLLLKRKMYKYKVCI